MQTPTGVPPNMEAVGKSNISATNATVRSGVAQTGVRVSVPAFEPRGDIDASEAIGERTLMEQILSDAYSLSMSSRVRM